MMHCLVSLILALCGISVIVGLGCGDTQTVVTWKEAITDSLAAGSFHFRISLSYAGRGYVSRVASENASSQGTERKRVGITGAFEQPDRVRWGLSDIDGTETRFC